MTTDFPNRPQVENAVKVLNEALTLDRKAVEALFKYRVPCNESLAAHPTIQVTLDSAAHNRVGILGLINGIFGVDSIGYGYIAMEVDENDHSKIERFLVLEPK